MSKSTTAPQLDPYSGVARFFHWLTVIAVLFLLASGSYMTYRGQELNMWDETTNAFYTTHKLVGFILLWVIVLRLAYKLFTPSPAPLDHLSPFQRFAAEANHWLLYGLLLAMPILGWLAISLFDARDVFGLFKIPALVEKDQAAYKTVASYHELGGWAIMALISVHIGAVLFHTFVQKDGIWRRMWPSKSD